jgi:hypothetical protein
MLRSGVHCYKVVRLFVFGVLHKNKNQTTEMSQYNQSCWWTYVDPETCDYSICRDNQHLQRFLLVYSNLAFLCAPLLLLWIRQRTHVRVDIEDLVYIATRVNVFIISITYHECSTSFGDVNCFSSCLYSGADSIILYYADLLAASFAVHIGLTFSWRETTLQASGYRQLVMVYFPFYALYLIPASNDGFVIGIVALGGLDWAIRYADQGRLFSLHSIRVLAIGSILGTLAILLQYSSVFNLPYAIAHSGWHICAAAVDMTIPVLFPKPNTYTYLPN